MQLRPAVFPAIAAAPASPSSRRTTSSGSSGCATGPTHSPSIPFIASAFQIFDRLIPTMFPDISHREYGSCFSCPRSLLLWFERNLPRPPFPPATVRAGAGAAAGQVVPAGGAGGGRRGRGPAPQEQRLPRGGRGLPTLSFGVSYVNINSDRIHASSLFNNECGRWAFMRNRCSPF